jgi:succinate-acetate transporter protein
MKAITCIMIFLFYFMFFYFLLSAIGLLWSDSYVNCIRSGGWFAVYSIFIGWWLAMFPTREFYYRHEQDLKHVF